MAKKEEKEKKSGCLSKILILVGFIIAVGILGNFCPNADKLSEGVKKSRRARTKADMKAIGTALKSFHTDNNKFPEQSPEGDLNNSLLSSKYYSGTLQDAYKINFKYWSDGKSYRLTSYGEDMNKGGTNEFDIDIVYSDGSFTQP